MSKSSAVGQITSGHGISNPVGDWLTNAVGKNTVGGQFSEFLFKPVALDPLSTGIKGAYENMTKKPSAPQDPGAPPSLTNATTTALQAQLQQEVSTRASRSLFSGSGGLLDDGSANTNVASRVLLGV